MPHSFKQLTRILTLVGTLAAMGLACFPAQAQNKGDDTLLEMAQAFRKNDKARLSTLLPQARGHVLEPLAAYWELRPRLDTASESEIRSFLTTYAGTYYEDRLRNDWLLELGRRRDWNSFGADQPRFRMNDDREVRCYALGTDAQLSKPETPAELKKLWYALRESDDGCTTVAEKLHDAKKLDSLDIWRKARLAMDNNRPRTAQGALNIESAELGKQAILIHADPQKYLDKRIVAFTRKRKELSVLALIRIANTDPDKAAQLLEKKWGLMLTKEEHNWTWGVIGKQAAQKLQDNAHQYFSKVSRNQDLNDDLLAWKARAALRQGDWKAVAATLDAMEDAKNDATWIYWKARAQLSTATTDAQRAEATAALKSIAGVKGFYEQLALEELGQPITVPAKPAPLTSQEKTAAHQNAGLQRALYALN